MYVILLALLAVTSAAPRGFFDDRSWRNDFERNSYITDENIFDTRKFWEDLSKELREIDTMIQDLHRQFPSVSATAGIVGDEYKVTVQLSGFDEKDIAVKAREGVLMIQAVHKNNNSNNERSYIDLRTLPRSVNVSGTWSYSDGVLTVAFPLLDKADGDRSTTAMPAQDDRSREEIETDQRGDDVGDLDQRSELETNEIPRHDNVQAARHTVDLNDEVELVPVRRH